MKWSVRAPIRDASVSGLPWRCRNRTRAYVTTRHRNCGLSPEPVATSLRVWVVLAAGRWRTCFPSTLPIVGNVSHRSWLAATLPIPGPLGHG
jgi:hypothetical protein